MSQREFLFVVAHAHNCAACRDRLLADPPAVTLGRSLSPHEKEALARLTFDDFLTPERLVRAAGVTVNDLDQYRDHPVARLRHF